jgi:hypothetical protein
VRKAKRLRLRLVWHLEGRPRVEVVGHELGPLFAELLGDFGVPDAWQVHEQKLPLGLVESRLAVYLKKVQTISYAEEVKNVVVCTVCSWLEGGERGAVREKVAPKYIPLKIHTLK